MCFSAPKPPPPPPAPSRSDASNQAELLRQRLAARRGFSDSIKTSALGASNYGQNTQSTTLGVG